MLGLCWGCRGAEREERAGSGLKRHKVPSPSVGGEGGEGRGERRGQGEGGEETARK